MDAKEAHRFEKGEYGGLGFELVALGQKFVPDIEKFERVEPEHLFLLLQPVGGFSKCYVSMQIFGQLLANWKGILLVSEAQPDCNSKLKR